MGKFRGALTAEQVLHGIGCCLENAEALIEDAKLLLENGRPARCTALCLVAAEELAKIPMLANSFAHGRAWGWRSFWRRFRSHLSKLSMGDMVFASEVFEPDLAAIGGGQFGAEYGHVAGLREMSLYVDWLDGSFVVPGKAAAVAGLASPLLTELRDALEFHRSVRDGLTQDSIRMAVIPDRLSARLSEAAHSKGARGVRPARRDEAAALREYRRGAREIGRKSRQLWQRSKEAPATSAGQRHDSEE